MNDFITFVLLAQTGLLVFATLLLVYPVVAYARNVAHTRGLVFLSGAFMLLTMSYVLSFVFRMGVLSAVLDLASATLTAFGTWEFARPFVRFGDEELKTPTARDTAGGFESAGDD